MSGLESGRRIRLLRKLNDLRPGPSHGPLRSQKSQETETGGPPFVPISINRGPCTRPCFSKVGLGRPFDASGKRPDATRKPRSRKASGLTNRGVPATPRMTRAAPSQCRSDHAAPANAGSKLTSARPSHPPSRAEPSACRPLPWPRLPSPASEPPRRGPWPPSDQAR